MPLVCASIRQHQAVISQLLTLGEGDLPQYLSLVIHSCLRVFATTTAGASATRFSIFPSAHLA